MDQHVSHLRFHTHVPSLSRGCTGAMQEAKPARGRGRGRGPAGAMMPRSEASVPAPASTGTHARHRLLVVNSAFLPRPRFSTGESGRGHTHLVAQRRHCVVAGTHWKWEACSIDSSLPRDHHPCEQPHPLLLLLPDHRRHALRRRQLRVAHLARRVERRLRRCLRVLRLGGVRTRLGAGSVLVPQQHQRLRRHRLGQRQLREPTMLQRRRCETPRAGWCGLVGMCSMWGPATLGRALGREGAAYRQRCEWGALS
jgi:hypothetical protein